MREYDIDMRAKLAAQDWLTTVVEQEADATTVRVTGPMIDFVKPFDVAAMLDVLSRPAIRIVSLTVTEGGYCIDPATQKFDPRHPEIAYDAAHFDAPKIGLRPDRRRPQAPPRRGRRAVHRHVVRQHSRQRPRLRERGRRPRRTRRSRARRLDSRHVAFPNSMVDRITPATTDRERAILKDQYGVEDNLPVFCEEFRQWVVEDKFPAGRPALETVGATFVADVAPYELMKIRILNGGHAAIAYPAGLLDIHFVHEAMEDKQIATFLETLTKREILSVVPPPPGVNLEAYRVKVAERFANPKIGDTVARLCLDGSNRQPKFILPTVADRLKAGQSFAGLALVSAMWCRYCYGESESGKTIPPNDPNLGSPAEGRAAGARRPARLPRHARHLRRALRHAGLCRRVLQRADQAVVEGRSRHARRLSRRTAVSGRAPAGSSWTCRARPSMAH